jgi:hypothetical protein
VFDAVEINLLDVLGLVLAKEADKLAAQTFEVGRGRLVGDVAVIEVEQPDDLLPRPLVADAVGDDCIGDGSVFALGNAEAWDGFA